MIACLRPYSDMRTAENPGNACIKRGRPGPRGLTLSGFGSHAPGYVVGSKTFRGGHDDDPEIERVLPSEILDP